MYITHIRNATQIINYGGKKFLIDPMLAEKNSYPGFEGTPHSELKNPLVDLPLDLNTLLDVDAVIVTHTHPDHWDDAAIQTIPKNKQIFVQNEQDLSLLHSQGFTNLSIMGAQTLFDNILLTKTSCQHGSDQAYSVPQVASLLGQSSGVVFKHPEEKTLYLVGDSIWVKAVEQAMEHYTPEIIILNTGFAQINGFDAIIMGKEDVLKAHLILPHAHIIAIHMEALNHCILTRKALKNYVLEKGITSYVSIPNDGDTLNF